jgi:YjbR
MKQLTSGDFRRIALGMAGAVESSHMNHPDFRVNGRIFATLHEDLAWGMVKLTPEQQARFVRDAPKVFVPESGAWGRAGCTAVRLDTVDEETLGEALTLAFQNATSATPARRRSAPRSPRPRAARRP